MVHLDGIRVKSIIIEQINGNTLHRYQEPIEDTEDGMGRQWLYLMIKYILLAKISTMVITRQKYVFMIAKTTVGQLGQS